ncbi:hypothetical protein L1887_31426 [Cichorium endivia]|nr:hypothetical protein L1887_31426 [Cichorium endivia]
MEQLLDDFMKKRAYINYNSSILQNLLLVWCTAVFCIVSKLKSITDISNLWLEQKGCRDDDGDGGGLWMKAEINRREIDGSAIVFAMSRRRKREQRKKRRKTPVLLSRFLERFTGQTTATGDGGVSMRRRNNIEWRRGAVRFRFGEKIIKRDRWIDAEGQRDRTYVYAHQ